MAIKVLHIADLSGIGGVEQKVRFYIRRSNELGQLSHSLLVHGRRVHPMLREDIANAGQVLYAKYLCGVKLPKWPRQIRGINFDCQIRKAAPDVVMIWNRFGDEQMMSRIKRIVCVPVVHCECGSGWYEDSKQSAKVYLEGVDAVICASHACRRMLELRWGWDGPVASEINGLRPDCDWSQASCCKTFGRGEPIRLGVAGRVSPRKGITLAVHALAALINSGRDAELHIAGLVDGVAGNALLKTIKQLNLESRVKLYGIVSDMAEFYKPIDFFLCPSLREPFGSVCLEASAFGCVVVATGVDGLVEAVQDGVTGRCIRPTLPLEDYSNYGGTLGNLPSVVYDPFTDQIRGLRIVDPLALATAIGELADNPDNCEQMSQAGIKRARQTLHFDNFVRAIDRAVAGVVKQ